jgi:protein TonB
MNATRDLILGVILSLLVHGAFFGLPLSSGGRSPTLTHKSIPLEISFVKLEVHEDATPKAKPISIAHPERVRQDVKVREKKGTKRPEKSPVGLEKKPITPLKEERTLMVAPEPFIPPPQAKITNNAPQQKEGGENKSPLPSPLPSAEDPLEGEGFNASLIPKTGNASRSRLLTLARPRYDRNPKPPYPWIARRRGYEGVVVLKVEILSDGRVGEVRTKRSSGHPILDRSALKTVKKWKFIPAKRGDEPIRVWAEIPIKFQLE